MQPDYTLSARTSELALVRHKVLRNTYLLLALSMIPTLIGAMVGVSMNFAFVAQHPIISTLGMFAVFFVFFMGIRANQNNGLGVALLLGLTGFLGLMLGPILQTALSFSNGGQMVALAAGGTSVIFFSLAGIATVTRKDFSFLGNFLFVGLILLVIASLANLFFQVPAVSLALSAVAVLIFAGYLLYDVSRIINGGETNYIMATLALYLDIYNIFVNLLNLLMAFMGNRE